MDAPKPPRRGHLSLSKMFGRHKEVKVPAQGSQPPVTALPTRAAVATIPASTNVAPLKHTISAALEPRSVLETAREELWKAAYEKFREDQPESLAAYEALIVDQNDLLDAQLLVPETAAIIVKQQRERMESKQWTYSWFGAPQKVRDTAETVLKIVQDASDLVSVGMKAAPIYVSLPWSMITVLVPLIMNDFSAVSSAIDGLKEVASIMACYTYAEKEFLTSPITRSDFTEIVTELYSSILQYQACAAIYFGKSTLKRIGLSTRSAQTWPDAISKTRLLDSRTRGGLLGIQTKLTQHGFENLDAVMRQGLQLMQQVSQAVSADRAQRQQVMEWISMINPYQDHTDVLGLLGDQYSGSGQWLLSDKQVYLPWKSSTDGMLLLQGAMGQGKSSLTAMVIGDVLATSTNAVAFAYCSENASPFDLVRTARNKSINILRCLLAQCAILPDGTVAKAAQYAYDCSSRQKAGEYDANLGSLVRLLQEVILEHPSRQVTFVVDALDECSDRSELVTRLKEIARSGASVRIFVSARPHISISPAFDRRTYQTVIMESLNIDDIRSYVDVEVSKRYEISGMDPSQADRLRAALKRQADGMFRWVVLEIDLFLPKEDVSDPPADIERRLCNLEASKAPALTRLLDAYSDIYELALGKPDATSRRHCVQSAIDWALCCLKPLTVEDLVRTACVQSDGGPDIGLDGNTLLKYCSSLLIVTARGTIRLAHLSVRQFFEERKAEQFSKDHMHKRIALTSITVRRRTKDPHSRSGVTQDGREWLIDLNTGLSSTERYCFWNWSTHYRLSKTCSIAAAQMEHHQGDLVTPIDDLLLWTATVPDLAIQDSMGNTVLHRAIYDRRMDYVIALLHVASVSGSNDLLTKRNNAGKNALHLAALTAFAEAANLLLSTGADLMGVDACGLTALHLGVLSDCEALISSAGFDGLQATRLAAATLGGNTLLHFAAFFDRDSRVRESLILGFGLDAKNVRDETALDLAKLQPSTTSTTTLISAREGRRRLGHQDRPGVCLVGARQCDLCSMEEWIAGSRSGRQYVVAPSVHAMSQNRSCKLCSAASHLLLEQLGEQEDSAEVKVKLTLNCDTDLEDGADTIKYTVSSTAECEFELCIIDDGDIYDIDFEDLGERKATFQSRSFQHSGISNAIQHWRKDCKFHARCGREGDRRWPKRVIEVGTSDASGQELTLKLREARPGPQCDERYIFLSFNWGGGIPPRLTTSNYAAFRNGIDYRRLPQLYQEAIYLAQTLGYRYIWVDSLCIVQDSAEDWGEHIIMLPSYIVDADMVFAATAPSVVVSLNPLPQDENIICRYTATLLLTGDTSDEIFEIAVRRSLRVAARVVQEDVISRAWRLQEAVLAERLVIFGTEQVYWSCSAGLGSQSRMSLASRPPIRTLTVFLEDEREIAVDGILDFKLRRVFDYWYYLAHLNTNGKLTVSPGRLSTVAALASALSPYAESEYSAGLWNADIVRGLLWQSQLPRSHSTAGNSRYDAPSWSWASANGPISYSLAAGLSKSRKGGVSKTHRFAVLENNVHEDAPFSNVQLGSSIRVSSHSCRVAQLDPAILSKYDYFFDDASFGFLQRTEERLADVTLILLAPWTYTPEGKSRWAGLMISNERWQTVSDSYHRRGIFLGPACGTDLSAWKRREFVLV